MIKIRKSEERGFVDHGWLKARHTFSFADYFDRNFMSFRSLRVMNEDVIEAGHGFGTHPHKNAEIITYILEGEIEHQDSMGNSLVLKAGEIQRMSAGSGITHSEVNPSKENRTHLYQVWLKPKLKDIEPSYEQKLFLKEERQNKFQLIISPGAEGGSLGINQDARVYLANLDAEIVFEMEKSRYAWVQVLSGSLQLNNQQISTGDGVAISLESQIKLAPSELSEIILFDLA